jgi:phosphatidylethanolamine-binding protein (PEBP) family uncharacterized protein
MYNIPPTTTKLPENAGVVGSPYGPQIVNVFDDQSYDGPCPPRNVPPLVHDYMFTVYAVDQQLKLRIKSDDVKLLDALLADAGRHILARASITGRYSSTP